MVNWDYNFFGVTEHCALGITFLGAQKSKKADDIDKPDASVWSFLVG